MFSWQNILKCISSFQRFILALVAFCAILYIGSVALGHSGELSALPRAVYNRINQPEPTLTIDCESIVRMEINGYEVICEAYTGTELLKFAKSYLDNTGWEMSEYCSTCTENFFYCEREGEYISALSVFDDMQYESLVITRSDIDLHTIIDDIIYDIPDDIAHAMPPAMNPVITIAFTSGFTRHTLCAYETTLLPSLASARIENGFIANGWNIAATAGETDDIWTCYEMRGGKKCAVGCVQNEGKGYVIVQMES